MTLSSGTVLAIGLGCSSAATSDEVLALIDLCLAEAGLDPDDIVVLGTHLRRHGSPALRQAAASLGVPLHALDDCKLAAGVPGTCEAVAAAAGHLLLGKRKSRYATCAIALCRPGFAFSSFGQLVSPSASIASPTVATSWAGP